ncbi:MAG: VWA domain-containing protein [Alphaproteobacteria bacterium]|nr:VWA domain-containing protein [Alphaproteobacteria bacterium]
MMTEWYTTFHFLRPWWLLLALVPLWWLFKSFKSGTNKSSWEKIVDARLLKYLLVKGSSKQRQITSWLAGIGMLFAIVAVAGPSWVKEEIPALEAENPLMIALNLSSDMQEKDVTPSRLNRAKFKIKDIVSSLKNSQIGFMVYSGEPFIISPFSDDGQIISNLLSAISYNIMPINGDRIDRAIDLAVSSFAASGYIKGEILLITSDAGQGLEQAITSAKKALANGYKTNVFVINSQNVEKLKMISDAGGGKYIQLSGDDNDVSEIIGLVDKPSSDFKQSKNWQSVWLDYGYYLLFVPLLCCLYFFRKGILVIGFLFWTTSANASFFLNDNQEGLMAFNNSDFATASQKFKDSEWKGASDYRQGNFETAYKEFAKKSDVRSLYNQGNALAKGGKIDEAIAKYEEVLKVDDKHEDAKFNLEYLKQQKKQQEQQQNQQQQEQKEQQQNQDQQSGASGSPQDNTDQQNQEKPQDDSKSGKQNQEQEQNSDSNNDTKEDENKNSQNRPQPVGEDKSDNKNEQEKPQTGGTIQQGNEKDKEYDEEIQARAQQYREIPEDPGGLLRAFIRREYERNRYNN